MDENSKKERKIKRLYFSAGVILVLFVGLCLLCIWLFTASKQKEFVTHFSFASTVTSIILSVLAIFLSISGEMKTQTIRDEIEHEAKDIVRLTRELEDKMVSLSIKMDDIHNDTSGIIAVVTNKTNQIIPVASGNGNTDN